MYKVTIEGDDLKEPIIMEYDHCGIDLDRGLNKIFKLGKPESGGPSGLKFNGQKRACIKLWSGCQTYDSFIAEGTVWE